MRRNRLSLTAAAARLRVPPAWLRKFLAGKVNRPRPATIRRLAIGTGLPEETLKLASLSDQAHRLAEELSDAIGKAGASVARSDGSVAGATEVLQTLQAAPVILPPTPLVSDDEWTAFALTLSQQERVAIMTLVMHKK